MNPRVKSIDIYPLKSGAGLPVDNVPLLPRGLGRIHVGDEVEIISHKPLHPALQKAQLKFGR